MSCTEDCYKYKFLFTFFFIISVCAHFMKLETVFLWENITIQNSFIYFNLWASTVFTSPKSDLTTDFTHIT